jgi:probable H4MPT-linked C1 transfer pathway protein
MMKIVGLDVGGAHLKVAVAEGGSVRDVRQIVCPLWQGLDKLEAALAEAAPLLPKSARHAITMTGELSDLFTDRLAGASQLVHLLAARLGPDVRFWLGARGFGSAGDALAHPADVGSTNFLATATLIGRNHRDCVLIDFGSTTADIIPIRDGTPCPLGLTDGVRQVSGELVYTGFTRTAVMGVTTAAPFRGQIVTLAREYLATMADVRRILGIDLTAVDLHATADGKGKSIAESTARFARMFGRDAAEGTRSDWQAAAAFVREAQLRSIHDGLLQVLSRVTLPHDAPVIAAGIGAHDAAEIARRLDRPCQIFGDVIDAAGDTAFWATACAPAVAVALLAASI